MKGCKRKKAVRIPTNKNVAILFQFKCSISLFGMLFCPMVFKYHTFIQKVARVIATLVGEKVPC